MLTKLALRDQPVALIASDQRIPEMTGIEMLEQARTHDPGAKFLLLTAYADTDVAIKAINDIGLDYYLLKPWDPPEERLYPVIDGLLDDWRQANPDHTSDVRVVGHRWSDRSHDIKTFLARNHVPYRWYDIERDEEGQRLRELANATADDLPLVLVPEGEPLRSPSTLDLADALGLRTRAEQPLYDLCIVGGGPAGLAAAVYAASEGLSTVIVECEAPGGQAGQSAAIENYLGFPKGLSGSDLTQRAVAQVVRFGADMVLARAVVGFEQRGPVHAVLFEGGAEIEARALVVATGVSYRLLEAEGLEEFTGRGDGHLEALTLADRDTGATEEVSSSWLFVFIGASPRTDWLGPDVVRDDKGLVVTGQDLLGPTHAQSWPLPRAPFALETSVPGVFAAGDVRLDSMKRVASAVGEGAMSVYLVHRYLATI